jgi:hypothetical protein
MNIITEQDQNNIYDLYQEGILTRARAGLGSFISGAGVEGKLNNIIGRYKTKIGRELGDLEADFKTFKGSIQPAQQAKLNTLLTNLGGVGVQSAQSILGKFGHMIGRVVGAAAPAAAVGAATAAFGGAPALVGAAAGLTRGMRNVPRTDITGFDKLARVATSTGAGALAGYGTGKLGEYLSRTAAPSQSDLLARVPVGDASMRQGFDPSGSGSGTLGLQANPGSVPRAFDTSSFNAGQPFNPSNYQVGGAPPSIPSPVPAGVTPSVPRAFDTGGFNAGQPFDPSRYRVGGSPRFRNRNIF